MTRRTTGPAPAVPLPSPKERRRLREARALSEEQLAAAVGVTAATIRSWETGRTSPRGRRRAAYARAIGSTGPGPEPSTKPSPAPAPAPAPAGSGVTPGAEGAEGTEGAENAAVGASGTAPAPVASPLPSALPATTPEPATPEPSAPAAAPEPAVRAAAPAAPDATSAAVLLTPEQAFDALYLHTAPGLVRQTYVLTGHRKLARQSVERAFQVAWARWPEVARDRDPAGWVRAVAYEYAMSPWRRLRLGRRRPDALPEDPERRALLSALLAMPSSYRRALLLHDGVGLGLAETAAETEASTPATAGRLVRARAAVAERLPELADAASSGRRSPVLRERLGALALAEHVPAPSAPSAVRRGGERRAGRWTRATVSFGALLVGATCFTLSTAPTQYVAPIAPAERVEGVPALSGPQKLTPQDLELRKTLSRELNHGPERLVPHIP
ncbi:helix-turn-helix domain-containing protein [Streptomyces nitrosporeus]